MVSYDPKVIQEYAERLYKRANGIVFAYTVAGILIGFFIGRIMGSRMFGGTDILTVLFWTAALGGAGYWIGNEKVFHLKFQAQVALCQMKIEENTRKP